LANRTISPLATVPASQMTRHNGGHVPHRAGTIGGSPRIVSAYTSSMTRLGHIEDRMRGRRIVLIVLPLVLALAGSCVADQLQWAPLPVCQAAAKALSRQPFLVSFCSQAEEDNIELWTVTHLAIEATPFPNLFEIIVTGTVLYRSDRSHSSAEFPVPKEQWTFHDIENARRCSFGIDLAYVYVHLGSGSFRCLAKLLGMDCLVAVETLRLPDDVMEKLATPAPAVHFTPPWSVDSGATP